MSFTKNIVTDYGAAGDGVTNDRAAFIAFKTAAAGLDAVLTGPAGKTYKIGARSNPADSDEDYLFSGITALQVDLNGSKFTDGGGSDDYHFGARHGFPDAFSGALIATVAAGVSTIVLQTDADHTKFAVGDWAMLAGFQMMEIGFPINPHFFEAVQVLSKQTSVSPYTITFTAPLRNTYKSTWPNWGTGFGPATLYVLDQSWNCTHNYLNFTVEKTGAGAYPARKPTNGACRSVVYQNVTPTNYDGINPTVCNLFQINGGDWSLVAMEVDKCIRELRLTSAAMGSVTVQSTSVDILTIESGTTLTGTLIGGAKKTVIDGISTHFAFIPGGGGFGRCDEIVATNSVFGFSDVGGWIYKGGNAYLGDAIGVDNGLNTMTSGVIRIPKSYQAKSVSWAVPGTWCCWQDQDRLCIRLFQVTNVTDDATYIYIQTSEAGTWPSYNTASSGQLWIRAHPCPKITVTNCSETAPAGTSDGSFVYGLNSAPAGSPLYSYAKRVFKGETSPFVTNEFGGYLWGNLVSVKMNANPAYTGAVNPAKMQPLGWFNRITLANGSLSDYIPEINIRTSGQRTVAVVAGAEVDTNLQSGDAAYTLPQIPMWLANYFFANMKNDIRADSGAFAMTVEITTSQGIPAAAVSPLRLRLHA